MIDGCETQSHDDAHADTAEQVLKLSHKMVWERYVEATRTALRGHRVGPSRQITTWPAIVRDLRDALMAEEGRMLDAQVIGTDPDSGRPILRYRWGRSWVRPGPPSREEIDRAEEVLGWTLAYLAGHEQEARALQSLALKAATRSRRMRPWRQMGVARQTLYRWRDRALARIVEGLAV